MSYIPNTKQYPLNRLFRIWKLNGLKFKNFVNIKENFNLATFI